MRAPVLVIAACAALAVSTPCGLCLSNSPMWADDIKTIYAAEMQQINTNKMASPDQSGPVVDPVSTTALASDLARLEQTEEKMRNDRRAIALFATLFMVAIFLLFFFTTVHLDEAIKDASKLTRGSSLVQVDQRL